MMPGRDAEPAPSSLRQEVDGSLLIEWNDGHQSRIGSERLRGGCPCAMCREQRASTSLLKVEQEPSERSYQLRKVERVGRYAISLTWGDGHSTGIYSWPILRGLCDCFQCRAERNEL
jgi:DUF971 family protein